MTYHERDLLDSRTSTHHQQSPLQRRTGNQSHNQWYSSRLSPSQSLRIECKAEERHFLTDSSPLHTFNSSLQPIRYTMTEQYKPVQFRSQIIVHNNPDTDVFVERLQVAFYQPDELPKHHSSSPPSRSQSLNAPRPSISQRRPYHQLQHSEQGHDSRRTQQTNALPEPQALLHQWIDDICANEHLMSNDDIVFFIKNGEFFARI
ncbi:unnamed protein product [Adineta ricciae]|uniref:Uncharacterized protein n=1 Tax=Adineta ricciae TaxID=249248 RepID=A0A813ZBE2_ADIRI|nr:unnamed protein product [Adineta ricciae]CAF1207084.1 unnamed protein product [Adineta ricciae]